MPGAKAGSFPEYADGIDALFSKYSRGSDELDFISLQQLASDMDLVPGLIDDSKLEYAFGKHEKAGQLKVNAFKKVLKTIGMKEFKKTEKYGNQYPTQDDTTRAIYDYLNLGPGADKATPKRSQSSSSRGSSSARKKESKSRTSHAAYKSVEDSDDSDDDGLIPAVRTRPTSSSTRSTSGGRSSSSGNGSKSKRSAGNSEAALATLRSTTGYGTVWKATEGAPWDVIAEIKVSFQTFAGFGGDDSDKYQLWPRLAVALTEWFGIVPLLISAKDVHEILKKDELGDDKPLLFHSLKFFLRAVAEKSFADIAGSDRESQLHLLFGFMRLDDVDLIASSMNRAAIALEATSDWRGPLDDAYLDDTSASSRLTRDSALGNPVDKQQQFNDLSVSATARSAASPRTTTSGDPAAMDETSDDDDNVPERREYIPGGSGSGSGSGGGGGNDRREYVPGGGSQATPTRGGRKNSTDGDRNSSDGNGNVEYSDDEFEVDADTSPAPPPTSSVTPSAATTSRPPHAASESTGIDLDEWERRGGTANLAFPSRARPGSAGSGGRPPSAGRRPTSAGRDRPLSAGQRQAVATPTWGVDGSVASDRPSSAVSREGRPPSAGRRDVVATSSVSPDADGPTIVSSGGGSGSGSGVGGGRDGGSVGDLGNDIHIDNDVNDDHGHRVEFGPTDSLAYARPPSPVAEEQHDHGHDNDSEDEGDGVIDLDALLYVPPPTGTGGGGSRGGTRPAVGTGGASSKQSSAPHEAAHAARRPWSDTNGGGGGGGGGSSMRRRPARPSSASSSSVNRKGWGANPTIPLPARPGSARALNSPGRHNRNGDDGEDQPPPPPMITLAAEKIASCQELGVLNRESKLTMFVEHCLDCHRHNMSLRHNPHKYEGGYTQLDSMSRRVSEVDLTLKRSNRARLGSFEVTLKWMHNGFPYQVLLHSKLESRKFPSLEGLIALVASIGA